MPHHLRGRRGLPVLGETLALFADPYGFAARHRARYGEIFRTNALGKKTVILLNAPAHEHILVRHQDTFLAGTGYGFLTPLLEGMLLLSDGDQHRQERKWVTPAFHGGNMTTYLTTINRIIGQQLDTWGQQGTIGLYPEAARISFKLGAALLLGLELREETDTLLGYWMQFADGVKGIVRMRGPQTAWGRALIARRKIDALAAQIVAKQRLSTQTNMLQLLLDAHDEAGNPIPDAVIVNWVRFFLFAAYDTTTGTFSWLMTELMRHPQVMERVRVEVNADAHDAPITLDDFKQKPYLDAIINETLRLYPQVMQFIRGIAADDTFQDVTLPRGWNAMIIPAYTQRREDYFADPLRFDPDRFLPPREEQKQTPYAFVGFGGGGHACLGEGVARLELKALLTALLRRFPTLDIVPDQDLRQVYIPLSRPKSDVLVTYQGR